MARIMDKWGRSRSQIAAELGHGTAASVRRCVINNYKEKDNVKEDYKYVSREFAERYPKILEVKNRRRDAQGRRFATVVVVKPNGSQDEQGQEGDTEERQIWLSHPTSPADHRKDFFQEFRVQDYADKLREKDLVGRAECVELALDCRLKPELLSRVLQVMVPDMPERKRLPFCELLVEEASLRN
ncbi:uncharacterized protein SCHCODRAFT_01204494 [Schizophyllum commune H4-8]|uniref:uncharacterized protein n=1 Tax=Schizophyllum commune (strain H4-8 / FGSC 9210) TaxID=578458 RepID=UPI00215DF84A|nr:uncharacterized protein SCHCODRAFT_01204494 [Schizophyllum commune H4-8]KAI5887429.1 hypothetical protein SCHCODRAFT_01204494 [Schizophyllum commune H4-8]